MLFTTIAAIADETLKNSVGMPDDLFKVISGSRGKSGSGGPFVKNLPAEFRRNYSIMIDTESKQSASPLLPRILMNNGTGTAQVAVALENPDHFEVQNFHQARFYHSEVRTRDGNVNLNEKACQRCHYNRPNWSSYPVWAGQLGFLHDTIYEGSEQAKLYRYLLESLAEDPIFSQLELPTGVSVKKTVDKTGKTKYEAQIKFTPGEVTYTNIGGKRVRQGGPHLVLTSRENVGNGDRMIGQFHMWNRNRVVREVEESKNFEVVKFALVGALQSNKSCFTDHYKENMSGLVGDFIPENLVRKLLANLGYKTFEELETDTMKRILSVHNRKLSAIKESLRKVVKANAKIAGELLSEAEVENRVFQELHYAHDNPQLYDGEEKNLKNVFPDYGAKRIALVRLLLEPSGVPVNRWSMEVLEGSSSYLVRDSESAYLGDIAATVLKAVNAKKDERENKYEDGKLTDCSALAKKSQEAIASFVFAPNPTNGAKEGKGH